MSVYDLIVIGGGPAGLTAGLYASRAQMKTLVLERMMTGGQAASTEWIENYPGFEQGVSGAELASKMEAQARRFGLEIATAAVTDVRTDEKPMSVVTDGGEILARSLIIATGSDPKKLNVPGEAEFRGKGVSYCATCDGPFFKEKDVVTVGGGSSGVQESLYLTRFVKSIRLVEFTDRLNAEKILQQRARENGKISVFLSHRVISINGAKKVESVTVENRADGTRSDFRADGVFIWVGLKPNSEFLNGRLPLDAIGGILTDADMATNIPGVFAAGDVRAKTVRQVSTAVGDATIAAESALHYVESVL
ncbi:thioredoxin-disulfide reductase [bacterium]|nr:thioredoxin-disulfide reductase [bacterium]